jgi:hypothetical protein
LRCGVDKRLEETNDDGQNKMGEAERGPACLEEADHGKPTIPFVFRNVESRDAGSVIDKPTVLLDLCGRFRLYLLANKAEAKGKIHECIESHNEFPAHAGVDTRPDPR